jgi:hypothetical protein
MIPTSRTEFRGIWSLRNRRLRHRENGHLHLLRCEFSRPAHVLDGDRTTCRHFDIGFYMRFDPPVTGQAVPAAGYVAIVMIFPLRLVLPVQLGTCVLDLYVRDTTNAIQGTGTSVQAESVSYTFPTPPSSLPPSSLPPHCSLLLQPHPHPLTTSSATPRPNQPPAHYSVPQGNTPPPPLFTPVPNKSPVLI